MNKRIKEPELFHQTTFRNIEFKDRGIKLILGQLVKPEGLNIYALQSIDFDDKTWKDFQIADWMKSHAKDIELSAVLPDEAANLWFATYNQNCIGGMSSDEAAVSAWARVKEKFYQDQNGQWFKFAASWDKAVLSNDRPTIELVKAGEYPQGNLSIADLDQIVENFKKHNTVAVGVDHQSAGPALGWLANVWRQGESLWGTLRNLSTDFAKAVKNGDYLNRSVEIAQDLSYNGVKIGKTLVGITFLGKIEPASKGMALPQFKKLFETASSRNALLFSIDDNEGLFKLSQQYKPSNSKKGENILEITQEALDQKIKEAADSAVVKFKAQLETDTKAKLADKDKEIETLKAAEAKRLKEQIKLDAQASYDGLLAKNKITPAQKDDYIGTYIKLSADTEVIKLADGKETTAAKRYEASFANLSDKINLNELTKAAGEKNSQTDSDKFEGADEQSIKDRDAALQYCEKNTKPGGEKYSYAEALTIVRKKAVK